MSRLPRRDAESGHDPRVERLFADDCPPRTRVIHTRTGRILGWADRTGENKRVRVALTPAWDADGSGRAEARGFRRADGTWCARRVRLDLRVAGSGGGR